MIDLFRVFMSPTAKDAVAATLDSGWIGEGPRVKELEAALCRFAGWPRVAALNSGTSALQLALYLAGVKGRRVISTPMTCAATNTAILAMGGEIVWCDVDPQTGNMDPEALRYVLQEHEDAAAVVAVDWAGVPCDWSIIAAIAGGRDMKTIRDAAHAFGAPHHDAVDFTCYSFQAIKHLTTGDGGALVCRSEADHERARRLRWFGLDRTAPRDEQIVEEAGWKYQMNDVAASIGLANLAWQEQILAQHRDNARALADGLPRYSCRRYNPAASWWVFPLSVADPLGVQAKLAELGIASSQVHRRNDRMPAFPPSMNLPGVDAFCARHLSVPCGWWLDAEQVENVIDAVRMAA